MEEVADECKAIRDPAGWRSAPYRAWAPAYIKSAAWWSRDPQRSGKDLAQYVHRASKCDNKQSVSDPLALQNCQNNKDTGTDAVKAKSKICKATSTVICAFVTQSLSLRLLFRLLWYRFRCFLYRSRDCRRLLGRRGRLRDGRRSI